MDLASVIVLLALFLIAGYMGSEQMKNLLSPRNQRRTRSDDAVDEAFQTEAERNAPPPEGLPPRSIAICGSGEIPRLARLVPDSWRWFLPGSAKAGHPLCEADGQCRLVIGILFESLSREELCPESLCRAVARLDGAAHEAKLVRAEKGEEEEWPAAVVVVPFSERLSMVVYLSGLVVYLNRAGFLRFAAAQASR